MKTIPPRASAAALAISKLGLKSLIASRKTLSFHWLGLVEKTGEVEYLDISFY